MAVSASSFVRDLLRRPRLGAEEITPALAALGWTPQELATSDGATVLSLSAGGQPQVLIAVRPAADDQRSVSLGYSHEAVLTLHWDPEHLRVHHSGTWRAMPGDRPLIEVAANDSTGVAQVLDSLSRDQFETLALGRDGDRHPPLPEMLARAFAEFRLQVADAEVWGAGPGEVAALRLFHQLLFMRFHEDRFSLPPRRRLARSLEGDTPADFLGDHLRWYARQFNSELFGGLIDVGAVPQRALSVVIRELVEPWERLQLDFSVTTNEVAGRLYQSYLRLAPARVDVGRLFPGMEIQSQQKQRGAYYTPAPIARLLVRETLGRWLDAHRPAEVGQPRIVDPACGSGAFLVAAYRLLLEYWEDRAGHSLTDVERSAILSASIFGADTDLAAVMLCRTQLLEEANLSSSRLPNLADNIVALDSLSSVRASTSFLRPGAFDIVVTNPPFAAPRLASTRTELEVLVKRFPSLKGTGRNLAYAFAELALELLSEDGRGGLVLPRALLDGPSSAAARSALGGDHLHGIVDFGRNLVFDGTLAYIAGVLVGTTGADRPVALRLRDDLVSKLDLLDYVDVLDLPDEKEDGALATAVARRPSRDYLSSDSWAPFTLRWRHDLRGKVSVPFKPLGSEGVPKAVIGTQTGADHLFLLSSSEYEADEDHVLTKGYRIPRSLVPLWVSGEDIRPFRVNRTGVRVVIPQANGHPDLDRYIASVGGVPKSARLGQLHDLSRPKILVRNLFSEPAAAADLSGELMVPQGVITALVPADPEDVLLGEALLNSSFYQWLLQGLAHPRSHAGRLMAHHWRDVPWPMLDSEGRQSVITAGTEVRRVLERDQRHSGSFAADEYWAARAQLDEVVLSTLGASRRLRGVIKAELWRLA